MTLRKVLRELAALPTTPPRAGTILVTGAAGEVATLLRPHLHARCLAVRLSDIRPVAPHFPGESFVAADLRDVITLQHAMRGVDAVLHLGAIALERDFDELLPANIVGAINLFETAREAGVRRVVLASTMHVLGFYGRDEAIGPGCAPRPDSRYAVTKLFAENLGAYYAHKWGFQVACLRIGHVTQNREDAEPASWIAPEELAALAHLGLTHPDVAFEVMHAVAPYHGDPIGQAEVGRRFGFRMRRRGGSYAGQLRALAEWFRGNPVAQKWRGGVFASETGEMSHDARSPR